MAQSGLDNAIRELEMEAKRLREAIGVLRGIRPHAGPGGAKTGGRNLSPAARKRISQAAKKRWAALRAEKKKA